MKLTDKTIVITGGTSGVGYEMVKRLAPDNLVLVIARPGPRLDALTQNFPNVQTYPADLSKPKTFELVADQIIKNHSTIDVLINNAAVQNLPTFLADDFSYDSIETEIHTNFTAVCALSYLFLPALLANPSSTALVNINSGLALTPKRDSAIYSATKAAMDSFTQTLRYQLEDTHIQVLQAFLPLVDTPMTKGRGSGKLTPEDAAQQILRGIKRGIVDNNIGKVKLLRFLLAIMPGIARKIMKGLP